MNSLHFLSSPVVDALGWTLLHALWQGFALVLSVAVVLYCLRNRASALRYRISVSTLLSQLVASAITFIWYYEPVVTSKPVVPVPLAQYAMQVRWQTVSKTVPWHEQTQRFLAEHLGQFVLIYLIGVAVFGLRLVGGWVYLRQLSRTATPLRTTDWIQLTSRLRSLLSIKAIVQVRESTRIVMPMVVGVMKPILLLPVGFATSLSISEVEAIVAHELAHVKRYDYAINLLQSVVEVLYFFHPALWWLSARVREEREHCCDDLAVQISGGDGQVLARALARVEELRLIQLAQPSELAMAFASNRQHLLHRVRRVLGVQTRPFVSNGSLAGLTLATILLMSLSVYAVQKHDKPKAHVSQPKPTRRHKIDKNSEYGVAANHKLSYIIWKGKRLSNTRVAALQRQLDQVMAGQLSLDSVPQPDRDILLTVIEKNYAFDAGMNALSNGLAHIDYDNIVASALTNVPLSPDGTVEGLAKVNYDSIIQNAMTAVDTNIFHVVQGAVIRSDDRNAIEQFNQRQIDSLSRLIAQRSKQAQTLQLQMEKFQFPIEELKRSQEVLNWRKEKLMEQRNAMIEKHYQLLQNATKQKLSQADVEKQLAALEPEIKKLEGNMEELNKQFEAVNAKEEEAKVPMDKLKHEAEQLEEQINKLSDEINKHTDDMALIVPDVPTVNAHINRLIRAPRAPRGYTISPTLPLPPAPPTSLRGRLKTISPAAPIRTQSLSRDATPAVAPASSVRVHMGQPSPKPAVAPKPEKADWATPKKKAAWPQKPE